MTKQIPILRMSGCLFIRLPKPRQVLLMPVKPIYLRRKVGRLEVFDETHPSLFLADYRACRVVCTGAIDYCGVDMKACPDSIVLAQEDLGNVPDRVIATRLGIAKSRVQTIRSKAGIKSTVGKCRVKPKQNPLSKLMNKWGRA